MCGTLRAYLLPFVNVKHVSGYTVCMFEGMFRRIALRVALTACVLFFGLRYMDGLALAGSGAEYLVSFCTLLAIFVVIDVIIHPVLKVVLTPLRLVTFGLVSVLLSVGIVHAVAFFFVPFTASWLHGSLLGGMLGILRKVVR